MDDDPRPMLGHVLDQIGDLAGGTAGSEPGDDAPFPGTTLGDVRQELLRILLRLVEAAGGDPDTELDDGWSVRWGRLRHRLTRALAEPGVLDRAVSTPLGSQPVRTVLLGQIPVLVLLGWDLAVSSGRHEELDEDLTRFALAVALRAVPADSRLPVPFLGPARDVPGDATDGVRLAAWLGHRGP